MPEPVADTVHLTLEAAEERLQTVGYPGDRTRVSVGHFRAVRAAYKDLRCYGSRTREQLLEHFPRATTVDDPERGYFQNPHEWWSVVCGPALKQMPDVRTPESGNGVWRYVGIEPGDAPAEQTTDSIIGHDGSNNSKQLRS